MQILLNIKYKNIYYIKYKISSVSISLCFYGNLFGAHKHTQAQAKSLSYTYKYSYFFPRITLVVLFFFSLFSSLIIMW